MSTETDTTDDAPPDDELDSAVEPVDEQPDEGGDERPALDEDEKATFDLDGLAEEVEEEIEAEEAETDSDDDSDEGSDDSTDEQATSGDVQELSLSWGDLYVDTISTLLVVVVEEYGDGSEITEEEIVNLASSGMIDVSAAVDQLVADMGGPSELSPEVAVVAGTALLAFAVLARETDVLADALGGEL